MSKHDRNYQPLCLDSADDLPRNEDEILERINSMPNGVQLLLAHPARLLAEVGIELSGTAVTQWEKRTGLKLGEPENADLYEVIERSQSDEVRYRLKGIFRHRGGKQ
jgi:hypothetical protein